ncbi:MAG TPA: hypothetical protein VJT80_07555 [Steroidobacteraceae bacterium]|nr:hypothetical protein [Steroidobacteraceae bacterium]
MSEPIDIKALDEYLKGGSDISQRYRELGREDVPPELDRRVLDEARVAVAKGGGRSRSWLRWGAPVALAASVVLAVTIVIESGPQNDTSYLTQPAAADKVRPDQEQLARERQLVERKLLEQAEQAKLEDQVAQQPPESKRDNQKPAFAPEPPAAPASAPAAPPPAVLAKKESERSNAAAPEEVRADAQTLSGLTATSPSPAPQVASEQPAFAGAVATAPARKEAAPAEADYSSDDLSSVSVTGTRARRPAGRTAGPRGTISGSALSSESRPAADEDVDHSDPAKWLVEIRELRRAGKVDEADRAWLQFREAFPTFPVADDDIARKK